MANMLTIEVGTAEIRVAEMRDDKKGSSIRRCFRFAVPQGLVEDGLVRDAGGLGEQLKNELLSRKISARKVRFIVASSRITTREVRIPFIKKNRIQDLIETNATDYFPIDPAEYNISYRIIDIEEEGEGKEKEKKYHLMVYACPKDVAESYEQLAEAAGLMLSCLAHIGDSVYMAVRDVYKEGTHMLIKIEEDAMLVSVVRDGELRMQRNINYGINGAVEAVQMFPVFGEHLSYEEALSLMRKRNCVRRTLNLNSDIAEPEDETEEIKEARTEVSQNLRYLVGNISRIMDYYLARNPGNGFDTIECCGIGAAVLGVTKLLSHELAQKVTPLENAGHTFAKSEETDNAEAIYIALFGVDGNSANLMEQVKRGKGGKKKRNGEDIRGAVVVFVIGAAASIILVAFSLGSRLYQTQRQKRLNTEITKNESAETIYNEYKSMKEKYSQYEQMYNFTNTPNESLVAFLGELEQNMQDEIDKYCEQFSADIKEEDGIVLAQNIEKASGITIDTVGTGVRLMVSDDGTVDEESTEQQQTLSEQDNAATKEQVDKIEGNTEATTETQQQTDDALIEDSPTLYRTQDTLSYKGSYENLKKAVTYINGQTGRMTVDNITMTFDSGSGGLTGTMTVNIYSMSGIGNQYSEPDAGTSTYGKKNLFGRLQKQK